MNSEANNQSKLKLTKYGIFGEHHHLDYVPTFVMKPGINFQAGLDWE
jgi:hypothetical protein